jgi:hypothetical protein
VIQFVTHKESHDDWSDQGNSLHWHDENTMKDRSLDEKYNGFAN